MTAASSRHPFRTLAAWAGLVVLFVTVALVGEAYWGVGVFVAAVVALLALVEVVGQKVNPHVEKESVGEGPVHVETVDQVARFDEDWDRACRMVDRWLEEDEGCPDNSCARGAALLLSEAPYTYAVCPHGVPWSLDRYSNPPVVYSGARFHPDRLVELS